MYEKPQYLTPDGYRRSAKNPLSSPASHDTATALALIRKKKMELLARKAIPTGSASSGKKLVLSEEAAKAIAAAISGMLKK